LAANRLRPLAAAADRNRPFQPVRRRQIILRAAERRPALEVAPRAEVGRTAVSRRQAPRQARIRRNLGDKTREPSHAPLSAEAVPRTWSGEFLDLRPTPSARAAHAQAVKSSCEANRLEGPHFTPSSASAISSSLGGSRRPPPSTATRKSRPGSSTLARMASFKLSTARDRPCHTSAADLRRRVATASAWRDDLVRRPQRSRRNGGCALRRAPSPPPTRVFDSVRRAVWPGVATALHFERRRHPRDVVAAVGGRQPD